MKINWKVRFKNPVFLAQLFLSVIMPVLTYAGLTLQDLTTWTAVGDLILSAVSNPYVLGCIVVSVWNCINDPTTAGVSDSDRAMTYTEPKKG